VAEMPLSESIALALRLCPPRKISGMAAILKGGRAFVRFKTLRQVKR
jgi:hypothetical protein